MTSVISVENLSKSYHLGQIGTGTFANDLKVWWSRVRGKPNPLLKIGQEDYGNRNGEEIWALRDISFTVEQGDVLGVIGKNGAGKSTLLKILSRVTAPTKGKIKAKGRIASLLEVGTGFHPELTGRENVYLNGTILGMTRQEVSRKFDEIVDFAGIEKFIDTPVKRYSSGMYVRLAFAVAAHLDPDILIVDEVLAVGDADFQKKCLGKMGEVAQGGRTVLFVSHNMASIQSLCSKVIVVSSGQVAFQGDPQEAIKFYLSNQDNKQKTNFFELENYRTKADFPIFGKLSVADINGQYHHNFDIEDPIYLYLRLSIPKSVEKLHLAIGLNNVLGIRVFTASTRYTNTPFQNVNGEFSLSIVIRDIKLSPGQYFLKLTAGDSLHDFDIVENIPAFEVMATDYWGTGKLPLLSQGVVLQNVDWVIKND